MNLNVPKVNFMTRTDSTNSLSNDLFPTPYLTSSTSRTSSLRSSIFTEEPIDNKIYRANSINSNNNGLKSSFNHNFMKNKNYNNTPNNLSVGLYHSHSYDKFKLDKDIPSFKRHSTAL